MSSANLHLPQKALFSGGQCPIKESVLLRACVCVCMFVSDSLFIVHDDMLPASRRVATLRFSCLLFSHSFSAASLRGEMMTC